MATMKTAPKIELGWYLDEMLQHYAEHKPSVIGAKAELAASVGILTRAGVRRMQHDRETDYRMVLEAFHTPFYAVPTILHLCNTLRASMAYHIDVVRACFYGRASAASEAVIYAFHGVVEEFFQITMQLLEACDTKEAPADLAIMRFFELLGAIAYHLRFTIPTIIPIPEGHEADVTW